jgi:5-oxoprolinase (ATP-hydrolysing)
VVEAVSVEALGARKRRRRRRARRSREGACLPPRTNVRMFAAANGATRRLPARRHPPGDVHEGPGHHRRGQCDHRRRSRLAGRGHALQPPGAARVEALPERRAIGTTADPVMLEIFNNLFMSIAEQMGLRLQNTAYSVNIKERLDFSCAIFDADGNLVANAPHMPVHLGSMGESIKTVMRENAGACAPATSTC